MKCICMFVAMLVSTGLTSVGLGQSNNRIETRLQSITVAGSADVRAATRIFRLEYTLRIKAHIDPFGSMVIDKVDDGPAKNLVAIRDEFGPLQALGRLEPGDIITYVDGRPIRSESDYRRAMYLASGNQGRVALQVYDPRTARQTLWQTTAARLDAENLPPVVPRQATGIKVLLIGQTTDATLGAGFNASLGALYGHLRDLPNFDAARDVTVLSGDEVTAEKIMQAISGLQVKNTEAFFCFYAGHGAHDPSLADGDPAGGHFFDLPGGGLMRRSLLSGLQAKGAQMTVLVSDSCNMPAPFESGPFCPQSAETGGRRRANTRALQELLVNHVGVVDVSGSARDQYAWYTGSDGGWFTSSFITTLETWRPEWAVDWNLVLEQTSRNTSSMFQVRKREILAPWNPNPSENLKRLHVQADQSPQTFVLNVKPVRRAPHLPVMNDWTSPNWSWQYGDTNGPKYNPYTYQPIYIPRNLTGSPEPPR